MKCGVIFQRLKLIIYTTLLLLFFFMGCTGDPGSYIQIDNRTDQTLVIFIDELQEVDIPPSEVLRFGTTTIWPDPNPPWGTEDYLYLIEAKTEKGEVVYSDNFTWQELDDMDWTIVIPTLQKVSESSDNATGK